jgi:hypothetical protein
VRVQVRSGNTSEPNGGWSPWREVPGAAAPPDATGGPMGLPSARFLQVRVELSGDVPPSRGVVQRIVARYRKHNRPPELPAVEVLPLGVAYRALPPAQERSGKDPVVDPMIRAELQDELSKKNDDWRPKKAYEPGALTVRWKAEDPDGDELRFRVEACRDGGPDACPEATLLAEHLPRDFFSFDSRVLPDGVYRFRIAVSDAASNHLGEIQTTDRVTDPFVVDHTPPRIVEAGAEVSGANGSLRVTVTAEDPDGRLVRAEVSVEPGEWHSLAPEDGVEDGVRERFFGTLPEDPGQRPVVVRVVDRGGNVTTRRLEVR